MPRASTKPAIIMRAIFAVRSVLMRFPRCRARQTSGQSVDQLERELDLPRVAGGLADLAKTGAVENVGGQAHGDDVEEVEELAAELQVHQFGSALAAAEGGVLDECKVEVVERRTAKGIAPERAEAVVVRPRAAGYMDGDGEEVGSIAGAVAKIVLAVLAGRVEMRLGDLVGAIDSVRSRAGFLNSCINGKG